MTVSIYLAHLNPVTNAHVEIIDELKKESDVIVMPVIFLKKCEEVNSRRFPFSFEIREQMLNAIFGNSIKVSKNYMFHAPFWRYLPPLISPYSWVIRKQILKDIPDDFFTYTGDKAEGLMLKAYRLHPKIGIRKTISATSIKNKLYDAALGKKIDWEEGVPHKVVEIIKHNWKIVEKYANMKDETTSVFGMKFPKNGYWSK